MNNQKKAAAQPQKQNLGKTQVSAINTKKDQAKPMPKGGVGTPKK